MDLFEQFGSDSVKEEQGVWKDIGGGTSLLVARSGNRKHARLLSSLVEANQLVLDAKSEASDDLSDEIMIQVAAETILLGWKTKDKDGNETPTVTFKGEVLPFTIANAKRVLAVKDFRARVNKIAGEFENYRAAQEAEAVKN